MTRTQLSLAFAAILAAPAFAHTTTSSSTAADVSSGTTSTQGAYVAPLEKNSAKQSAMAKPGKQAKADSTTSSTTSTQTDLSSATKTRDGAFVAPLEKNSAKQQAAADCDHPQAGKLADKSTGQAKEHSASPVHSSDCVTDAKPVASKKKSTKTAKADTK